MHWNYRCFATLARCASWARIRFHYFFPVYSFHKYRGSSVFVFQLSWGRNKYWVKQQEYSNRTGTRTNARQQAYRSSLKFTSAVLAAVFCFLESLWDSVNHTNHKRLRTLKNRQGKAAEQMHIFPHLFLLSLPRSYFSLLFFPFLLHMNQMSELQPMRSTLYQVLLVFCAVWR